MKQRKQKKKFKLTCDAGSYEAGSMTGLMIEVVKHRFAHLIFDGVWRD